MKHHYITITLIAAALLFSASLAPAAENNADVSQEAASTVKTSPKSIKKETNVRHKHAARIKLVDINSATKKELKKLPCIGDAEADKIIAGRPFGSKAWLVTKNIIPKDAYTAIEGRIICKLTKKEIDQILATAKHENKK